jgi:hypothetical protein
VGKLHRLAFLAVSAERKAAPSGETANEKTGKPLVSDRGTTAFSVEKAIRHLSGGKPRKAGK